MTNFQFPEDAVKFIDWSKVEWSQLSPWTEFKWTYGVTPFSHVQVPVWMTVFYLLSIRLLSSYMKDRKPYTLKLFSQVHNLFLTLLSLAMWLGASYGAWQKYNSQGFWAGLLCEQEEDPMHGPLFYWSYIFYLSKFYEYIDTWLLILKKKPLIFLHVWHHMVMPYVAWAGLEGEWAMALWTSCFWNSFVHVVMYSYYFLSSFGYNIWWKKYLTMLQIYQFVSGVLYTFAFYYYYFGGLTFPNGISGPWSYQRGCTGELWAIQTMFFVNNSFLVLFVKFFIDTYKKPSGERSKKSSKETKKDQ